MKNVFFSRRMNQRVDCLRKRPRNYRRETALRKHWYDTIR